MSEKTEKASAIFGNGFNCAQAVLSTFSPAFGLDAKSAVRVSVGFGAGMGRMGKTCGAVTGAYMAIGLAAFQTAPKNEEQKRAAYALVREFTKAFESRHRTTVCAELLGEDLATEAGMAAAKAKNLFTTQCVAYVEDAVAILEEILPSPRVE